MASTEPDYTGTTEISPVLVPVPTPDSTEMPGIHGEGDKQRYELFISEPDESAALQATYTVAHEESPAEKQLGDFASTMWGIGNGSRIEGAILDKNCRIGQGVQIFNERKVETRGENEPCIIRDGIPIVVKEGVLPDGYKR